MAYRDRKTRQLDDATAAITTQIGRLRVYRLTLISEVVTVRRDVRDRTALPTPSQIIVDEGT